MKPVLEFLLVCLLVITAGCSAVAGFFQTGSSAVILLIISIIGLFVFFFTKARSN